MAIYHVNTKNISRGKGHSSTAKSAYICATKITDYRTGEVFDYSRKKGVLNTDIVMPSGIDLKINREELWNKAEATERRKDSRVGREWEISLPHELSNDQKVTLTKELTQKIADRYGVACEYAIHIPSREGSDERNYHVHILSTTRKIDNEGNLGTKSDIELENKALLKEGKKVSQEQIKDVREEIANVINRHLERAQVNEKISHKTLKEQGINREPTTHKGKAQFEVEKRLEVEQTKIKINITHDDAELAKLNAELEALSKLKQEHLSNEVNCITFKGDFKSNDGYAKQYSDELFNIAREHKEFFTKKTVGRSTYYVNRDESVEIHTNQIKIHKPSQENIRLALDVAVNRFGNKFEVKGSKSFINDTIKEIASNEKYINVSLDNKEHQALLDKEREKLSKLKAVETTVTTDLMSRVREHLDKQNVATEASKLEEQQNEELSPIEKAKRHLASLNEQPKNAKELAKEFRQKSLAEKRQQEQEKQRLKKVNSRGRGFRM